MKNCLQVLLIAFLVVGCGVPASPTQPPVASSTEIFSTLTATALPTMTEQLSTSTSAPLPTATSTPEPGLRTNGPYFAYFREVDNKYQLVMMDADGGGRKAITLPPEVATFDVKYVSPDGKWLAFYTGSAGDFTQMPVLGAANLTLNLLNLTTGETQIVTPLLSKDYPNNFEEAARRLNNPDITAGSLYGAFVNGIINAFAWSPNGQYLAFAGQMDGLSSDLYVYDMTTKNIQRLSSGDEELQWIEWSPDGKWILQGSTFEVGMGTLNNIYASSFDGISVKYLVKASEMGEWLNPHAFVVHDNQNGLGNYEFRLIDINEGSVHKIWDGPVMSYGLNSNKNEFAVFAHLFGQSPYLSTDPDPDFVPGLYLINLKTFKATYLKTPNNDGMPYYVNPFGVGDNIFVFMASGVDQTSYLLSDTSNLSALDIKGIEVIKSSPDASRWMVVADKTLEVYSSANEKMNSMVLPFPDLRDIQRATFVWQPDSSGLILISGTNIYFVNNVTGKTKLVENNYLEAFLSHNYMWINSQ